jgi:hypothetical protein
VNNVYDRLQLIGIDAGNLRVGENRLPCPRCAKGARDEALAVRVDGDAAIFCCFRCGWSGSTRSEARTDRPVPRVRRTPDPEVQRTRDIAARIWSQCVPLAGTEGEAYLDRRACLRPPPDGDLRFHPRLFCPTTGTQMAALVGRVSTAAGNRFVGVHRVYLNGTDKAVAKLRLGRSDEPVCIRLWPDDAVESHLAIAEGIETALSAAGLRTPIWSCIDAGQLAQFPVLRGIASITVFADADPVGERAALECATRWRAAGREVLAVAPAQAGADFNDRAREVPGG